MYECPNCSGNLKFNIEYQQMHCEHCDTRLDVNDVDSGTGAEENNSFDVTIFTCSQCGGELYTTDNTVAGFCSFCGSTAILESRIAKELRPDYIIPFFKSKEACKKEYMKMMKWAIFAPSELKKEKYIEGFRGIYMPYWIYDVKQENTLKVLGTTTRRSGDYIITSHYNLSADLDAHYNGVPQDGSSSFADNISRKIAPYNTARLKEFNPAYLSGFYADTADVEAEVYADDVATDADIRTTEFIRKNSDFVSYEINEDALVQQFDTTVGNVRRAMLPVWFLSYRNKDRVAYATVNGQTGKVVADLPVDMKKYLLGTVVLAIPVYILLSLFLTLRPDMLLAVIAVISMFVAILHALEMKEIAIEENGEDDEGLLVAMERKEQKKREEKFRAERELAAAMGEEYLEPVNMNDVVGKYERRTRLRERQEKKNRKKKKHAAQRFSEIFVIFFVIVFICIQWAVQSGGQLPDVSLVKPIAIVAAVVALIAHVKSCSFAKELEKRDKLPKSLCCVMAVGVALVIVLVNPVSDLIYYAGSMVALVAVFLTLWDLIRKYNVLATRKLPQFDYKGGDDRA